MIGNMQSGRFVSEQVDRTPLEIPKPIQTVQLQTTVSTIYTASTTRDFVIKHLWAANTTGTATTYTLYLVPSGGSAGTANTFAFEVPLAANTTVLLDASIETMLQPGMSMQGLCAANNDVNIGGWGMEYAGTAR